MSLSSSVNRSRRILMGALTKSLCRDKGELYTEGCSEIKRVLIVRPNSRLGNQLMVTPLLQEVERLFPNAEFDIFVRSRVASILFQNYKGLGHIISLPSKPFKQLGLYISTWVKLLNNRYDLIINAAGTSSSGRLMTRMCHSKYKIFCSCDGALDASISDYQHMAKQTVYSLRKFIHQSDIINPKVATLNIKLSDDELSRGDQIIEEIVGHEHKTIGIYTFATGTKCFSKEWWDDTYQKLVEEFGDEYNIVEVLPIENISQIDFKAPSYYSRDIREMVGVIDHFEAFLTADCGIMHLASATKTPVISLFSVTQPDVYRPYNRGSIDLKASEIESKDEIVRTLSRCLSHS